MGSFDEAKSFVNVLKFRSIRDWEDYEKKNLQIYLIQTGFTKTEVDKLCDWLGTGTIVHKIKLFVLSDAKKYIKTKYQEQSNVEKASKENKIPEDIPAAPDRFVVSDGLIGEIFLAVVFFEKRKYYTFEEARKLSDNFKYSLTICKRRSGKFDLSMPRSTIHICE